MEVPMGLKTRNDRKRFNALGQKYLKFIASLPTMRALVVMPPDVINGRGSSSKQVLTGLNRSPMIATRSP